MPAWSIAEWRARIGSSWCALGRPFKTRSPFRNGARMRQRMFTLNQVVTLMILVMVLIGLNLGLRALVRGGHHHPLLSFFDSGKLPQRNYLINFSLLLTLVLQITTAVIYQSLSTSISNSQKLGVDLTQSLSLNVYFWYYFVFIVLKMTSPLLCPIHWLAISVLHNMDLLRALSVFWKTLTSERKYFDKQGECLWILAVTRSSLDVITSVAASVIVSLLLNSGDVEENPGPGHGESDIDYNDINSAQIDKDDLSDVIEEAVSIKCMYFQLGRALRLRIDDLRAIRQAYTNEVDTESALNDVLLLWLDQKYNVQRFGPPTWRMLVEAVDKETGGNNHNLAKKIASNHPADTTHKGEILQPDVGIKDVTIDQEEALLDIKDTVEIINLAWDHRARWRFIGIELGIDQGTLDAISADERDVGDRLTRMINIWLRNTEPRPTQSAIKAALASERVSVDKLKGYGAHLKSLYKTKKKVASVDEDNWPPPVLKRTFRLAMIKPEDVQRVELATDYVQKTITGKVDDILRHKVPTELKDILKEGEQKTVLMEGAPGCGKSTLSLQICHQWAIGKLFQEYTQVILARLREHVVQMAASIADFLPQHSKARGEVIEEELIASNGKGVLFVLDGWDELPRDAPGRSIIKDLLERTKLPECSVIITSRPTSSARLHDVVDSRIEILGFTEEELGNFFAACLDDNIKNAKLLRQRIQENPIVTASCYLPLNASILVYLFKFTQKLPVTKFGIFSSLVRVHIYRHMMKTKQTIPCIDSLDKLPPAVEGPFKNICKMAYQGVMEDRIIFVNPGHDFNTLGLLQGVESFSDGGMSHSFNFLHLSIQEMLAAIYMATELTPEEQVARFRELFGRARFSAVFQFYAAKTKLQTPGIDDVLVDALSMCIRNRKSTELTPSHLSGQRPFGDSNIAHKSQPLLLSLLHCLYEAQDEILYESVVKRFTDLKLNLTGVSLNPADCLVVGSFLTHCSHFYVNVQQCSIGVEGCKTLFRPGAVYDLRIMILRDNLIGDEGAVAISEAMRTMTNLQKLDFYNTAISDKGALAISEAMKTMTDLCDINFGGNSIGDEGAVAISDAMKMTTNLQRLYFKRNAIGVEGAVAISEAMKAMTNLQYFNLGGNPISDEGAVAISKVIKSRTNLRQMDLNHNSIGNDGAVAISEAVKTMTNLLELYLRHNFISEAGKEALLAAAKSTGTKIFVDGDILQ